MSMKFVITILLSCFLSLSVYADTKVVITKQDRIDLKRNGWGNLLKGNVNKLKQFKQHCVDKGMPDLNKCIKSMHEIVPQLRGGRIPACRQCYFNAGTARIFGELIEGNCIPCS